ncbi:RICIN domain-containing protein [Pseudoalteromonas sp. OF7H-1]|uniref:RICIN domain-containing protein n=1 Tax=Pseudoalteromonas sp. OF7H-1 TaxID=2917755 RepID=UPI001EF6F2FD|nr:RICIN domain-containing protein [Pseudoalteromonas sp. OF7H-1]MCG7541744.1 RICIN domain-containing protein [Pseudoalteromonas sp. OF7H-1]
MKYTLVLAGVALAVSTMTQAASGIMFINKQKYAEETDFICMDGKHEVDKAYKGQTVQTYDCDFGRDQYFSFYKNNVKISIDNSVFSAPFATHGKIKLQYMGKLANYIESKYYGDPWFEIRPVYDENLCLDVSRYDGAPKRNVQFWSCEGKADQLWKFDGAGRIINKKQGKCLDVAGHSGGRRNNIMLYDCDGGLDQEWYYTPWNR